MHLTLTMECTSIPPLVLAFHDRAMNVVLINPTVKYNQYCGEVTLFFLGGGGGGITLQRWVRYNYNIPKLSECKNISQKTVSQRILDVVL